MGQGEGVLLTSSPCDGFGLGAAEIESSWTYAEPGGRGTPRPQISHFEMRGRRMPIHHPRRRGRGGLPSYGFSPLNEGGASAGAEPQA